MTLAQFCKTKSCEKLIGNPQVRQLVSLITGDGLLRKHLSGVGIHRGDVACRLCSLQEETGKHIVYKCDALERELRLAFDSGQEVNTDIVSAILLLIKGADIGLTV